MSTAVANEIPTVNLAISTSLTSTTTHVAQFVNGRTFMACSGRVAFNGGTATADAVTCKRCAKKVTL